MLGLQNLSLTALLTRLLENSLISKPKTSIKKNSLKKEAG
jgi:hypothetical protein